MFIFQKSSFTAAGSESSLLTSTFDATGLVSDLRAYILRLSASSTALLPKSIASSTPPSYASFLSSI
jgi:hypothetical protein